MPNWALGLFAFLLTVIGTGLAHRYALQRNLIDQPGERRNHVVATPRGGGIAMVAALLLFATFCMFMPSTNRVVVALLGVSTALVGGIGWWDDHRPLSAGFRLSIHIIAAGCIFLAGKFLGWPLWLGISGAFAALALINIWNFMDGIDGLAASQAVIVAVAMMTCTNSGVWALFATVVAGASLGFLMWNFPKARIFMGDVGSGTLGLALAWNWAGLTANDMRHGVLLLFPMAPFFIDASLTLILRMSRRERWWEAHSLHSYQIASRRLGSHLPVTLGFAGMTVLGASIAWSSGSTNPIIIIAMLAIWYVALAIMWRIMRTPAKDLAKRSTE